MAHEKGTITNIEFYALSVLKSILFRFSIERSRVSPDNFYYLCVVFIPNTFRSGKLVNFAWKRFVLSEIHNFTARAKLLSVSNSLV